MGTSFDTIYDRALITIQDYHLDELATSDNAAFLLYWQSILIISVPYFDHCLTSLDYDITTGAFTATLSEKEINILAEIMVYNWFSSKTQNVTQFELKLTNREFKTYAEANNLKEKSTYLNLLRDRYLHDIQEYLMSPTNFEAIFGSD